MKKSFVIFDMHVKTNLYGIYCQQHRLGNYSPAQHYLLWQPFFYFSLHHIFSMQSGAPSTPLVHAYHKDPKAMRSRSNISDMRQKQLDEKKFLGKK